MQEVSRYVAAMTHGLKRLRGDFPFSLRLIREIHGKLLAKGRGAAKEPGEFRRSQNWIGGSRPGNALYVPPPPEDRERIAKLGRAAGSALRVHELLQRRPSCRSRRAKLLSLSPPTVRASLQALADAGIVKEVSGRRRDRVFGYRRYLDLIASDTNA